MNTTDNMKYLVFKINSIPLAINITNVLEIIIPGSGENTTADDIVRNKKVDYHNNSIPVVELAKEIMSGEMANRTNFRIIISEFGQRRFGLLVDSVDEIVRVLPEDIRKTGKVSGGIRAEFIDGYISEEDRTTYIPALEKISSLIRIT